MEKKNIETIYTLTAVQEMLRFHYLKSPDTDPGFLQVRATLSGALDFSCFEEAWTMLVRRHPMLRASVHWKDLERPLLVIGKEVDSAIEYRDLAQVPVGEQHKRIDAFLDEDRKRGLDISAAPVGRLTLFALGKGEHVLIWTCHHLFLDGWSGALVMNEWLKIYAALCDGSRPDLKAPLPLKMYMKWLKERGRTEAASFWREELAGISSPTPLRFRDTYLEGAEASSTPVLLQKTLSTETSEALQSAARSFKVTLGVLMQTAWGLVLANESQHADVMFGSTVSGRPSELEGIEGLVGMFTNTIPVRVKVDLDEHLSDWLPRVQKKQKKASSYDWASSFDFQQWSDMPGGQPLFRSLFVFENFPAPTSLPNEGLRLTDYESGTTSIYPLTVEVVPTPEIAIHFRYFESAFDTHEIQRLLDRYLATLDALLQPDASLRTCFDEGIVFKASAARKGVRMLKDVQEVRDSGYELRSAFEVQLSAIWEQALGVQGIGANDNFFDLGGTSGAAVGIFASIEQVLGRRLPLATLFEAPTVSELAMRLQDDGWSPPWRSLVALQPQGDKPAIYCFHGGAGNILFYRSVAELLGAEQPCYALQAIGLNGEHEPIDSIPGMASAYIEEMLQVQQEGPFHLIGFCMGGKIAFEVAHQLMAKGHQVGLLGVIDTPPPTPERIPGHAATKNQEPAPKITKFVDHIRKGTLLRHGMNRVSRKTKFLKRRVSAVTSKKDKQRVLLREANRVAVLSYDPAPVDSEIMVYHSEEYAQAPGNNWHIEAWEGYSKQGIDTQILPGLHGTILLPPNVEHFARSVRERIEAKNEIAGPVTAMQADG